MRAFGTQSDTTPRGWLSEVTDIGEPQTVAWDAMIPRRVFMGTCALGLLARPRSINAQTTAKPATVGWLSGGFAAQGSALTEFKEGLRELGYVVGQNVHLDVQSTQRNESEEYPRLAAKLVAQRVDVILAANPHSLGAVTQATNSTPIVGVDLESDPIAKGWVAINELQFQATEAVARRAGLAFQPTRVTSANEIPRAIAAAAAQRAGGLVALTSPLVNVNMRRIAEVALEHRLSSICGFVPSFAEAGGLLAYGPDFADLFRRAAGYVVAILKGAAPANLPVQRPTKFQLVINRKTVKVLGLRIPTSLSTLADQVIE